MTVSLKLTNQRLAASYGWRNLNGRQNFHRGVDFAFSRGVPVSVMGDGVVTESAKHYEYGHYVKVDHGEGISTSYHSLNAPGARVGTRVKQGDTIGVAGSSALGSTGPHSHQGLWFNGETRDPLAYLKQGVAVNVTGPNASAGPVGGSSINAKGIQAALVARGYNVVVDGVYGAQTTAVVKSFQKSIGIVVDGNVGAQTWPRLKIVEDGIWGAQSIRGLQALLRVVVDGKFGPQTIKAFQAAIGTVADGIWGKVSISVLQRRLGIHVDGVFGKQTVTALQRRINTGVI